MYLSRLMLNPRSRDVRRDLANPRELHRTLLAAFPAEPMPTAFRKQHGVLYRLDLNERGNLPTVLVQSRTAPDWTVLEERPSYLAAQPQSKEIGTQYQKLAQGQVLAFRLRANPTFKTKTKEDGTRGKPSRVPFRSEDDCLQWLLRKAADHGFDPVKLRNDQPVFDLRVATEQDLHAKRGKGEPAMCFASAVFEGRLRITDAERFKEALGNGVGPAKAYGFGLLSVRSG